jgi:N-acylglucosamine 2-epimerase
MNGHGGKIGGLDLRELGEVYRRDLFEDCLPFLDKYIVDHEQGGFLCHTDRDGTHLSDRKETWFEGRGVWVYAFLYNHFGRDPRHLAVAKHSIEFILRTRPAKADELWADRFAREGKPLTPPSAAIYGDMFIAEGFNEYALASGEQVYWDQAKEIVLKCARAYDRPDYYPDVVASYHCPEPLAFPGARSQGVHMVFVRVISQMLDQRADAELQKIVDHSIHVLVEKFYNPAFRLNNELLNHDYSRPTNALAGFVYTGHSIETMWMLAAEALRRRDQALFAVAAERFRRHFEVAWDDVYGGAFRGLRDVDANLWVVDKVLWEQAEVLIGALMVYEQTGANWAAEIFEKTFDYVQKTYPLKPHGFGYWITAGDRKVTFEPHYERIENYHHPRHLMLNLLALKRMLR